MKTGRKISAGKAYLETDFLLFRGDERLQIPLSEMRDVTAADGWLELTCAIGPVAFELGPAAEKWAQKILNPPSLLDKLGVKPGLPIAAEGPFDPAFLAQLGDTVKREAALLFFAAETTRDLDRLPKLKSRLAPGASLWIVYPKGNPDIREADVLTAGRSAGLKDTKVARFSETHTALRFSTPK